MVKKGFIKESIIIGDHANVFRPKICPIQRWEVINRGKCYRAYLGYSQINQIIRRL